MSYILLIILSGFFSFNTNAQEESKSGQKVKPTVIPHGRIVYDFEFHKIENGISPGMDYTFNGQQFRTVRMGLKGNISQNIKYKIELDFKGGELIYRDMYVKFTNVPYLGGDIFVGSYVEATGLSMKTSGKFTTFFERSMLTNTQNNRWNTGIHYSNFGLLNGIVGLQLSYAFNGRHTSGFTDTNLSNGRHIVARLTSPLFQNKDKKQLFHIGVNYENRRRTENPSNYKLKFRPENNMGLKITIPFENLKTQNDIGFELAGRFGPLSLQAEYEISEYTTIEKNINVVGYYAAVTYFITGEHRGYINGAFLRIKPYNNVNLKEGNFGALELVARYSVIDYSDVILTGDSDRVDNVTIGFNWYLNSHARLMYNYVIADFNKKEENDKLQSNLVRMQVDF